MSDKRLPILHHIDQRKLLEEIQFLQVELDSIRYKIRAFESLIYAHLGDLIVEEQELFILYKQIKKAKKAKRLEQKKRGKNYKEPTGLVCQPKGKSDSISLEDQQEKKRLYREAIIHVHPDKFSMNKKETDLATEITTRLIEIYKEGSLETLRAFHAHIFKGNANIVLAREASRVEVSVPDNYLQQEKVELEKTIELAKRNQLYQISNQEINPMTYIIELKTYYEERLIRLRKRTRKGL